MQGEVEASPKSWRRTDNSGIPPKRWNLERLCCLKTLNLDEYVMSLMTHEIVFIVFKASNIR